MKFGNIVRVTEDKKLTSQAIRDFIDSQPGASVYDVASYFGMTDNKGIQKTNSRLHAMTVRAVTPTIKRKKLDGRYRYFPASYKMPYERIKEVKDALDEVKNRPGISSQPAPLSKPGVEAQAKDYVWDCMTKGNEPTLMGFVEWSKK